MCPEVPFPDSCREPVDGELEEDQLSPRNPDVLDDLARALFDTSVNPVKLVYEISSRFHAGMPARYKLMLPVALPHRLHPHIPGPPYHSWDNIIFHRNLHMAVLRPVLAGALHALLGSDAPVDSVLGSDYEPFPEFPTAGKPVWMQFAGVAVEDRATGFNLETGYWRGRCEEGYGIDAYFEYESSDEVYVVQWIVYHVEWRVEEAASGTYPPIVQLKAQPELEDSRVVFRVSQHPEWSWKYPDLCSFEACHLDDELRRRLERRNAPAGGRG